MKRGPLAAIVAVILLFLFPFYGFSVYYQTFLFFVLMYVALAVSWNYLSGYAGYLNVGQAGLFGLGAYIAAMLLVYWKVSPFLTAPLAGVIVAVLSLGIGYPCLRLRGDYFAIVTLVIAFILQDIAFNTPIMGMATGLSLLPPAQPFWPFDNAASVFYIVILAIAILSTFGGQVIEKSKFGMGLAAIREDEKAAETAGVPTFKYKMAAFAATGFVAGIVGAIYAYWVGYLSPTNGFDFVVSLNVVVMALFGGRRWYGPIIGAVIMAFLAQYLQAFAVVPGLNNMLFGGILIAAVLGLPNGISGLIEKRFGRRGGKVG